MAQASRTGTMGVSTIELIGALIGFACVVLTIRQHIACWPVGLVQVILYLYIFFDARLYSDAALQAIYVPMQIYGWWAWLHGGKERSELHVSEPAGAIMMRWIAVCVVGTGVLGWVMRSYTNASAPFVDACAAVTSLVAQWLMSRKVLQSWLLWIFVDVVSVGLYLYKELYPTAALYAIYLVLAAMGYLQWRKSMLTQARTESSS